MELIKFSGNPNGKLFSDTFGDVRLHDSSKYYQGAHLIVNVDDVEFGIVKVMAVRKFEYSTIRDPLSYLVCGKPAHYLAEMLRRFYAPKDGYLRNDREFDHVILQYQTRHWENQRTALRKWWEHMAPEAQLQLFS